MGNKFTLKRFLIVAVSAAILALVVFLAVRGKAEQQQVVLSDGRVLHIEAVTFGTNHVVGWNDWWLVPLRNILPNAAIQFLTLTKGQSRQSTDRPALVVWIYAQNAKGKYVDCQSMRASFVDEKGDVYPANTSANGAFSTGFSRQAHIFYVFPRRSAQLKLQLSAFRSTETSSVLIPNPGRQRHSADWTAEELPATRRMGDVELSLESLVIRTNGGPERWWEPLSLHWEPVFKVNVGGKPATNWETPEWEAQDATGNRGQTLGLHEPMLKFVATVYPKPGAVSEQAKLWKLPVTLLPTTPQGTLCNTNREFGGASVTVIGLFPPGAYTFSEGQLTNGPGAMSSMNGWTGLSKQVFPGTWRYWATHGATNYTLFLRCSGKKARIAVGLREEQGQVQWGRQEGGEVLAFVFDKPLQPVQKVELEVVLLEPQHAEFVVRPKLP